MMPPPAPDVRGRLHYNWPHIYGGEEEKNRRRRRPVALTRSGLRLGQKGTKFLTPIGHFDTQRKTSVASLRLPGRYHPGIGGRFDRNMQ